MVIDPSAATVTAMVAVWPEPSSTVIVAAPAPTDVIVTKPGAVVKSVVATPGVSETAPVPTMPKTGTVFAVELSVVATKTGSTSVTAIASLNCTAESVASTSATPICVPSSTAMLAPVVTAVQAFRSSPTFGVGTANASSEIVYANILPETLGRPRVIRVLVSFAGSSAKIKPFANAGAGVSVRMLLFVTGRSANAASTPPSSAVNVPAYPSVTTCPCSTGVVSTRTMIVESPGYKDAVVTSSTTPSSVTMKSVGVADGSDIALLKVTSIRMPWSAATASVTVGGSAVIVTVAAAGAVKPAANAACAGSTV